MKKLYILATASALVLSGCESVTAVATQGVAAISDAGSTAWNSVVQQGQIASIAEQQKSLPPSTLSVDKSTQEEYDSATAAYQKTVAQGAVLGGVIGGAACKFIADANDTQTTLCALGGVAVGSWLGDSVAKKNQALVDDRDKVLAELDQAKANREAAEKVLSATEANIDYLKKEIERLDAKLDAGTITADQYKSDLLQAQKESVLLASNLTKVQKDLKTQNEVFEDLKTQTAAAEDVNVRATTPMVEAEIGDNNILQADMVDTSTKIAELQSEIKARV